MTAFAVLTTLAEAYWMRFERTLQSSSREEAERALRKAAALDPDLPEVHYATALGFIVEGKYEAAKDELEQALQLASGQEAGAKSGFTGIAGRQDQAPERGDGVATSMQG